MRGIPITYVAHDEWNQLEMVYHFFIHIGNEINLKKFPSQLNAITSGAYSEDNKELFLSIVFSFYSL